MNILRFIGIDLKAWIFSPWPASLYYAARGHICTLCIYNKHFTIIEVVRYTICFFQRTACEPGYYTGRSPLA